MTNYQIPPNMDDSIFKAYDIRGIVDKNLTTDVVHQVGLALGTVNLDAGRDTIVVARDGRLSGPSLQQALIDGILATGCNVTNVGRVPTPVLYFGTFHLDAGSGVMLTGSHNPPQYNGLKMVINGHTLSGDDIQQLKQRIQKQDFKQGKGSYAEIDISDDYINRITSDIKVKRPIKLAVDCGNGVAGELAPKLFRALGCDVTEMYCEIDGNFPNHHPDPSQPDNLKDLIAKVTGEGFDLGFAFDGDGDRLGVVAPDGEVIWPDRQMILYAQDILTRLPGAEIIYDIKCSRNLEEAIHEAGGKPLMWQTGHSFIKAKLKESGAPLAGEMSGHIFFKERWYGFDDALYTGSRMLEILSAKEDIGSVFRNLPNMINTPELRIDMEEGAHHEFMVALQAEASFSEARVTTIDGLRADFENGWGLVRASNTTPCLVIRFEGRDDAAMKEIQAQFRDLFTRLDDQLKLPF